MKKNKLTALLPLLLVCSLSSCVSNPTSGSTNDSSTTLPPVVEVKPDSCRILLPNNVTTTVHVGDTFTLEALVLPSNAKNKDVKWSSNNNDVLSVENGKVTALSKGEATITISCLADEKITDQVKFTVTDDSIPAESVNVKENSFSLVVGATKKIEATVLPENTTDKLVFTSNNEEVATVSEDGTVTAKKAGTASITLSAGLKFNTVTVTVKENADEPTDIVITTDSTFTLHPEGTTKLYASVLPLGVSQEVEWTSSDSTTASVTADGTVTAKKVGNVTIKATSKVKNEVFKEVEIHVVSETEPILAVTTKTFELVEKETGSIKYTLTPEGSAKVTFESLNTDIATVSNEGVITAVKEGETAVVVKATHGDKVLRETISVKVSRLPKATDTTVSELLKIKTNDNKLYNVTGILEEDPLFVGTKNEYGIAYLTDENTGEAIQLTRSSLDDEILQYSDNNLSIDKSLKTGEEFFKEIKFGEVVSMNVMIEMSPDNKTPTIAGFAYKHEKAGNGIIHKVDSTNGTFEVTSNKYNKVGKVTVSPADGYVCKEVRVTYPTGEIKLARLKPNTNEYHFTVKSCNTIEVIFTAKK